jgi:two-component sensor histidine kinase
MGTKIRMFDWASTSIGPIEDWAISLKSIVQMMLNQRQAICLFWGADLNILYNDAYKPFLGEKEARALGQPFRSIWPDVWADVEPFVRQALAGSGTYTEDMPLTMDRNAYPEETYWTFSYSPLYDDGGSIAGLIDVAIDTTLTVKARKAQENAARLEETLRRELVHRVKNSIAVTGAVVTASLRNANSLEEARDSITRRIDALGKAQSLLARPEDDADLRTVVEDAMKGHVEAASRLRIDGPAVNISSQQAIKDGKFTFRWLESGGPLVSTPTTSGFGSRLTGRIVPAYFGGKAVSTYRRDGVEYLLTGKIDPFSRIVPP